MGNVWSELHEVNWKFLFCCFLVILFVSIFLTFNQIIERFLADLSYKQFAYSSDEAELGLRFIGYIEI